MKLSVEERLNLVREVGEEVVGEDRLVELFESGRQVIAYDGFEPSGNIHIAQGLLRAINVNKLTAAGFYFKFWVADWFAMLNNKMGGDLEKIRVVGEYFIEVWKACGMNMDGVEFVWTSEFVRKYPEYWETVLKLSMNTTVKRVLRCGQIMGRKESDNNPASQVFYPLMQAADIYHLEADVAQLGMDQRKVNMLARDVFPKLGFKPPVVVSHHMLMGLSEPKVDGDVDSVDRKIEIKMSKSKPDTAIFMTDSVEDVKRKFAKAYCPARQVEDNPVLEYMKYIVFERFDIVEVLRDKKFGGDMEFSCYGDLERSFIDGSLHPKDLKECCSRYISELLEPVRKHFEENADAKRLLEKVNSFQVTR